jgi:Tfp pilus assembly protein PilX
MADFDLRPHIKPLTDELDGDVQRIIAERRLLAHYCSMATAESIIRNQELWLSNCSSPTTTRNSGSAHVRGR